MTSESEQKWKISQNEFQCGYAQADDYTTEDQLKQKLTTVVGSCIERFVVAFRFQEGPSLRR